MNVLIFLFLFPLISSDSLPESHEYLFIDGIVAKVNNEIITWSDIEKNMSLFMSQPDTPLGQTSDKSSIRRQILDNLIDEKILISEGNKLDLDVTQEEIDMRIEELKKQNNFTDRDLENNISKLGFTSIQEYKEFLKKELLKSRVLEVRVRSKVTVSDTDVDEEFKKKYPDISHEKKVLGQFLLVSTKDIETPEKRSLYIKQLESLRTFALSKQIPLLDALKEYRKEELPPLQGGTLGTKDHYASKGEYLDFIENVLFSHKKGDISMVITHETGLYLIQVIDEKIDVMTEERIKKIKEELKEELYKTKFMNRVNEYLDELRKKSQIELFITL